MNFYFCEQCGKRLTDHDLEAGHARDKKLRGVYCLDCAVGVMTAEQIPAQDTRPPGLRRNSPQAAIPATPVARHPPTSSARISVHALAARAPAARHLDARRLVGGKAHGGGPAVRTSENSARNGYLTPGMVLAGILVFLTSALIPGGSAHPPAQRAKAELLHPQPPSLEGRAGLNSPPLFPAPTAAVKASPAPLAETATRSEAPQQAFRADSPQETTPSLPSGTESQKRQQQERKAEEADSPERMAQEAFEELVQFKGLASGDAEGRESRLEAYLKEHREAIVANRARRMLADLKNGVGGGTPPKPPPPEPATAGTSPQDTILSFNPQQKALIDEILTAMRGDNLEAIRAAQKIVERQSALPPAMAQEIQVCFGILEQWDLQRHKRWDSLRGKEMSFGRFENGELVAEILEVNLQGVHTRVKQFSAAGYKAGQLITVPFAKLNRQIRSQILTPLVPKTPEDSLIQALVDIMNRDYPKALKKLDECGSLRLVPPLRHYVNELAAPKQP